MSVVGLLWYLSGLFLVASFLACLISITPEIVPIWRIVVMILFTLSIIFAVEAVAYMRLGVPGPKWLVRALFVVALLVTIAVVLVI